MCTRVFWNDNERQLIVGRSMDWHESTEPIWTVFPRGSHHDGGLWEGQRIVADNAVTWNAKYGSVVVTIYGVCAADGLNEAGLGAHILYLSETDFGSPNPAKPTMHAALWAQYALDNAATVREALSLLANIQLVLVGARGSSATVHLVLEDAAGDSAIIEYIDGTPVVHCNPRYRVVTNSPTYDEQLRLLAELDLANPSAQTRLPGNVNPVDRFARATYFLEMLPEPVSERAGVASVLSVMRNVSIPFGAPYDDTGTSDTEYRTIMDLTNKRYFFEHASFPNVIWCDLTAMDFSENSGVRLLDPSRSDVAGEVTGKFTPGPAPY